MDVEKIEENHGMMQGWILMINHFRLLHTDFECKSDLSKKLKFGEKEK